MENDYKPALSVENLEVMYPQEGGGLQVLNRISFVLRKGEILALIGESGSGKSTCGKALLGLLPPSASVKTGILKIGEDASIKLDDPSYDWSLLRGKRIAMIHQDAQLALNPMKTIGKHFQETMSAHNFGASKSFEEKSRETLGLLNFKDPERIMDAYPFELSGGMCQRVYIALALCLDPEILIADEPTSALDVVSQREVLNLLKQVKERLGLSMILITHDIGVAYEASDRIIVLKQGMIVEEGLTDQVLSHPTDSYTQALVDARTLLPNQPLAGKGKSEPILQIDNISKSYGKGNSEVVALDRVRFQMHRGEVIGVLGFSGCGKTTLARCITGLEHADNGRIIYHGKDITHLHGKQRRWVCQSLQMVFQDARASLNPQRSAIQLVQEPLKYMGMKTRKERFEMARYYLNRVGIVSDAQNRRPPQLSSGQCQRVAIARALIVEPDVLVCDEAVSALDMILQKQILKLLQELQQSWGFAMLTITHDIRIVRNFCQMAVIMKDGEMVEFTASNCLEKSGNPYTKMLIASELDLQKKNGDTTDEREKADA